MVIRKIGFFATLFFIFSFALLQNPSKALAEDCTFSANPINVSNGNATITITNIPDDQKYCVLIQNHVINGPGNCPYSNNGVNGFTCHYPITKSNNTFTIFSINPADYDVQVNEDQSGTCGNSGPWDPAQFGSSGFCGANTLTILNSNGSSPTPIPSGKVGQNETCHNVASLCTYGTKLSSSRLR